MGFLAALGIGGWAEEAPYQEPDLSERDRRFWAFRSPAEVLIPETDDPRSRGPIDALVVEAMRSRGLPGLAPVAAARGRFTAYRDAIGRLDEALGRPFEDAVGMIMATSGHVVVCGMGKSGLIGRKIAAVMLDLFADVPSDSELFTQFSFISADDLPVFHALLNRTEEDKLDDLPEEDRVLLMSLPFKLIPARHRLGLIDDSLRERLVEARGVLYAELGEDNELVSFFDREKYNSAISVQDNILFGRLVYGQARAQSRVGELIRETVESLGLRHEIMEAGLEYEVGIGGSRLALG